MTTISTSCGAKSWKSKEVQATQPDMDNIYECVNDVQGKFSEHAENFLQMVIIKKKKKIHACKKLKIFRHL